MSNLFQRIWTGESVFVRLKHPPHTRFRIVSKILFGVKHFGIIPDGKRRVTKDGYRLLDESIVSQWVESLEEIPYD